MSLKPEITNTFVSACHKSSHYQLLQCSSGNLSWRFDNEHVLLSASRSWLGEISENQLALCRLSDGKVLNDMTPTVESVFHLGILRIRSDISVVLHFQSPYATAIACSNTDNIDFNIIPEIPTYIGKPAVVPFMMPGSEQLATATINAFENHNLAILQNHGLVTVGKDFNDAIQKAVFFELACRILVIQPEPKHLKKEDVEKLIKASKV